MRKRSKLSAAFSGAALRRALRSASSFRMSKACRSTDKTLSCGIRLRCRMQHSIFGINGIHGSLRVPFKKLHSALRVISVARIFPSKALPAI